MSSITVAALGRAAALGALYDSRTETFIAGVNVFECKLPNDAVTTTENPSMQSEFSLSDTWSEKMDLFNINGQLRLSIAAGLIDIKGAGSFLNEKKSSTQEMQGTFMINCRTYDETLNIYDKRVLECVRPDAIQNCPQATHVVVGIEWGAAVNVVASQRLEKNEDSNEWKGHMEGMFKTIISGSMNGSGVTNTANASQNVSIKIFADLLPESGAASQNVPDAMKFVAKIPDLIKKTNGGKGRQQNFHLLPVDMFELIDMDNLDRRLSHAICLDIITNVETEYDSVNKKLLALQDYVEFARSKKTVVPKSYIEAASIYFENCKNEFAEFTRNLGRLLVEIRSGTKDQLELSRLVDDLRLAKNLSSIKTFVENQTISQRLLLADRLIKAGILTNGNDFNEFRLQTGHGNSFVLFYSFIDDYCKLELEEAIQALEAITDKKRMAIDVDLFPDARKKYKVPEGVRICELVNQTMGSVDYLDVLRTRKTKSTVRSSKRVTREMKPSKSRTLVLACPRWLSGHNCAKGSLAWFCYDCLGLLDYGFDEKVYCECGSRPIEELQFRCHSAHHGKEHTAYSLQTTLKDELEKIQYAFYFA